MNVPPNRPVLRTERLGHMPAGDAVERITLSNGRGIQAQVITLGATLQSLLLPDRDGRIADVVLGYHALEHYLDDAQYFGATVGRYANRIANARFSLDGCCHRLSANEGDNALHGGVSGFNRHNWRVISNRLDPDACSITLGHVSADGEMGFPGRLEVTATYTLDTDGRLTIDYHATTDRSTVVNLSNHSYWNLSGEGSGSVLGHRLTIAADAVTTVDEDMIPTGDCVDVTSTAFDFRAPKPIGRDIRRGDEPQLRIGRGYDHNWVLRGEAGGAPRAVARVTDPRSGRTMTLLSNQPGLQFYSGNRLDGTVAGKSCHYYRQSDGLALEPQRFPDTPNQPRFGSAILRPGEHYRNVIVYRFSADGSDTSDSTRGKPLTRADQPA